MNRREFARLLASGPVTTFLRGSSQPASDGRVSLNGAWQFRTGPERGGEDGWREVSVPHTWQIMPGLEEYMGVAWYRRRFQVPREWESRAVRIEFEAVFHSATVYVNGKQIGEHAGKGYTAFAFDVSPALLPGRENTLEVRVDNSFNEAMLPRGRSSDWTHDGGIYRPVWLLVTPRVYIERVEVDALPDPATGRATVNVRAVIRNAGVSAWEGQAAYRVADEASGTVVLDQGSAAVVRLAPGETRMIDLASGTMDRPRLWHFDHPHLYRLEVELLQGSTVAHAHGEIFGIRRFEARDGGFYLNGERVFLMGVERMAGSNPEYGMAEPSHWIRHDHDDMKELNCVFTRVHWQQDRRVLDYCDRHGILIQVEVPAWGPRTFQGMKEEPSGEIMNSGLDQLREMIARDRNHPSVVSWGLCNEINGQNPPAYRFVQRMYQEAKKLDPGRLCSYASHSLQKDPARDAAGLMDFIEWNEYYESWMKGTAEDMQRNLEAIHRAFPDKAIVISEYGYCACTAERPEGDQRRVEILRGHDEVFRRAPYVGGLIFFCYNDYRTHIGDKGTGVMKQRVHGVVDVYGARKPSFEVLRRESSPVESLEAAMTGGAFRVRIRTRKAVPAYTLRRYKLRWIAFDAANIPLERGEASLPDLAPGQEADLGVKVAMAGATRVQFDIMRPTGFSALTTIWKP